MKFALVALLAVVKADDPAETPAACIAEVPAVVCAADATDCTAADAVPAVTCTAEQCCGSASQDEAAEVVCGDGAAADCVAAAAVPAKVAVAKTVSCQAKDATTADVGDVTGVPFACNNAGGDGDAAKTLVASAAALLAAAYMA